MKHLKAVIIGVLALYPMSRDCLAAATSKDVRTEVVKFADLDLMRPAGAQELYHRLQQATRDVCEPNRLADSPFVREGYQLCLNSAIAHAVVEVGAPLLTEHHESQSQAAILGPQPAR